MTVMGWGDTDPRPDNPEIDGVTEFSTPSEILMNVDANTISNEECDASEGVADDGTYFIYNGKIIANMLCARANGKDSCQGDSGTFGHQGRRRHRERASWGCLVG
jgi:secreted trypsin-like serine protease